MTDDIFDFGFTAVDEGELESVRKATAEHEVLVEKIKSVDTRAKTLYDNIIPLLDNLKANPDKDYIYWPNRYEKIDALADRLFKIMNGE